MSLGLIVAALLQAAPPPGDASAVVARLTTADIAAGQQLFVVHCANCHGVDGHGGRGPTLALPKLRNVADDQALFDAIGDGLPGTEMPAVWQLSDAERWRVVGYVRTLGRVAPEKVRGDAKNGGALYASNGCAACHVVRGEGSTQGPELTEIGVLRGAAHLRESLTDPARTLPDNFRLVKVRPRGGKEIEGVRLGEDPFTIQLRDFRGGLHSLRKDELEMLKREPGRSTMPSYKDKLSAAEIEDLVAYLAGLGRER